MEAPLERLGGLDSELEDPPVALHPAINTGSVIDTETRPRSLVLVLALVLIMVRALGELSVVIFQRGVFANQREGHDPTRHPR